MHGRREVGLILVFLAGVLYGTAGLFTRMLHFDGWTILAWRGVFGALFMCVWLGLRHRRGTLRVLELEPSQWAMVPVIALGGTCYIFALKVTTVADVMVIYATTPFITAAVAWIWSREVPSSRMMVASGAALFGVAVMMIGGFGSGQRMLGAGLTLVMNVTFAAVLIGARRSPAAMIAQFAVGTILCAVVGFALAPGEHVGLGALGILAAFGVLTIGMAMAFYMVGARLIPPSEVALLGIAEVAIGPALVWICFDERAGPSTVAGGTIVVGALLWHLWPDLRRAWSQQPPTADSGLV